MEVKEFTAVQSFSARTGIPSHGYKVMAQNIARRIAADGIYRELLAHTGRECKVVVSEQVDPPEPYPPRNHAERDYIIHVKIVYS